MFRDYDGDVGTTVRKFTTTVRLVSIYYARHWLRIVWDKLGSPTLEDIIEMKDKIAGGNARPARKGIAGLAPGANRPEVVE